MIYDQQLEELPMEVLNKRTPVLVTGGAGYIASWLVKFLLEDGYKVKITVRDREKVDNYGHLTKIAESSPGSLLVFEADLMKEGSFDHAMTGCNIVFHTASPFLTSGVKNAKSQLVDPALKGTQNVLASVNKSKHVKRVVLTSSVMAIYGDASDINATANEIFTEADWNKSSSLKHQPYAFSKTIAEKEAWKWHDAQDNWKLSVMNPGFVMGPSLTAQSKSGSLDFILKMSNGKYKSGVPSLYFGLVDVRDVAQAHIFAAQNQQAAGRHILVNETMSMLEMAKVLSRSFGENFPFPRKELSKNILYLFGFTQGLSWKYVTENVGIEIHFDNTRSKEILGVNYRSTEDSITELLTQIINTNLMK